MLVFSNNCCGGRLYQKTNTIFNNPFIWMVCPYDSIVYTMNDLCSINWMKFSLKPSSLRANTFILTVDDKIELHYIHYKFDPTAIHITQESKFDTEEQWTGDVYYNKIWEFVVNKYVSRVKRMTQVNELPCFLIRDESYGNTGSVNTIKDIAYNDSIYKRIIITKDMSVNRNDEICKTIHPSDIEMPEPTVRRYLNTIKDFFNI